MRELFAVICTEGHAAIGPFLTREAAGEFAIKETRKEGNCTYKATAFYLRDLDEVKKDLDSI